MLVNWSTRHLHSRYRPFPNLLFHEWDSSLTPRCLLKAYLSGRQILLCICVSNPITVSQHFIQPTRNKSIMHRYDLQSRVSSSQFNGVLNGNRSCMPRHTQSMAHLANQPTTDMCQVNVNGKCQALRTMSTWEMQLSTSTPFA